MMEKLYCPDFSAVLGPEFANPFVFDFIDTLQFPLLSDAENDDATAGLLSLTDERGHPVFYHRKISMDQWHVERACAGIGHVLFQAVNFGKHKLSNQLALKVRDNPKIRDYASVIIAPELDGRDIALLKASTGKVAGVVFYPLRSGIDLGSRAVQDILSHCENDGLPVKWDLHGLGTGDAPCKGNPFDWISSLLAELGAHPRLQFIFSGLELSSIQFLAEMMKYHPRAWLELDPRTIGGTTPKEFFSMVLSLPGFVQNCWDRVLLGSAAPTLEASQVIKGLWEATGSLPFHQQCLLRTWLPRNGIRVFKLDTSKLVIDKAFTRAERASFKETSRHVIDLPGGKKNIVIDIDASFQSFSITQLLWVQPVLEQAWKAISIEFPGTIHGEVLVRTFHTTTSLILNEHERGNFLQLHYDLCERTRDDAKGKLHTVAAEENRADFNYPDHVLASSIGDHTLVMPVSGNRLDLGGRENAYVLVTFGPRGVKLRFRFTLFL